jgi:carboxypeptidase C (cathepsin A)
MRTASATAILGLLFASTVTAANKKTDAV